MTAELARSVGIRPSSHGGLGAHSVAGGAAAKAIGAITAELTVIGTILFGLSDRERGRGSEEGERAVVVAGIEM